MSDKIYTAIGLMSGTSMDGVDAAIIKTDGTNIYSIGKSIHVPYSAELQRKIASILGQKKLSQEIKDIADEITNIHVNAVNELIKTEDKIDLIGFHGHTIYHSAENSLTIQIGNAQKLANETGISVISDLRQADIAMGGQGAPLVPIYHKAIARKLPKPIAFVNIGGVANLTWIDENDEISAFDIGPGNALINDWMMKYFRKPFDKDGKTASKGFFSRNLLESFLSNPYFAAPPPKSLDRNDFSNILSELEKSDSEPQDAVATLTAFTANAIAFSFETHLHIPKELIICGGGRHNKTMLKMLHFFMPLTKICPIEDIIIDDKSMNGDMTEAEAFAFLAVRSHLKMPITFPKTTGAPSPLTGGKLFLPS
jgi:anhydro-N-acetylmuramic acid kinase